MEQRCTDGYPSIIRSALLVSYSWISTATGNDVRDQSTRSSLLRGVYFSKTILRANVSSSGSLTRRAVPVNLLLLIFTWTIGLRSAFFTQSDLSRPPESI